MTASHHGGREGPGQEGGFSALPLPPLGEMAQTCRVALFFVNAFYIRGAWDEFLPGLSCTKSLAGSLNMHHTRSLLLNELLSEIYQRASYSPQPHKGNANIKYYIKTSHWLFLGKKKKSKHKRV